MKRNKIIIIGISLVAAILSSVIFFIYTRPAKLVPMTSLTSEDISRLQSYPYFEKTADVSFNEISTNRAELGKWIHDTLFSHIIEFEANEKFFTSPNLTYQAWNKNFAIRGVLQAKQIDGSITEQDIEYQYRFGEWNEDNSQVRLIFEGKKLLSEKKLIEGD